MLQTRAPPRCPSPAGCWRPADGSPVRYATLEVKRLGYARSREAAGGAYVHVTPVRLTPLAHLPCLSRTAQGPWFFSVTVHTDTSVPRPTGHRRAQVRDYSPIIIAYPYEPHDVCPAIQPRARCQCTLSASGSPLSSGSAASTARAPRSQEETAMAHLPRRGPQALRWRHDGDK